MTYLIRIGDIYFHDLVNNPYRFFGMELWVRQGRAEFDRDVRWCCSKGKGQGKELFSKRRCFYFCTRNAGPKLLHADELYANFGRFPNVLHAQDNARVRIP